jgi:hypothetical protein
VSRVSAATTDFGAFEAQFESPAKVDATRGHRRIVGWVGAAVVSIALWGGIAAGIDALVHIHG